MLPLPLYLFALCFLGHVFGDFLLQTEAIARGKQTRTRILLWHVTQHVLSTLVLLAVGWLLLRPTASAVLPSAQELAASVGVIAITHLVVDKLKILADQRWGARPSFFVLDQLAHVTVLTLVVVQLSRRHGGWAASFPVTLLGFSLPVVDVAVGLLALAALLYTLRGGAILAWLVTASMLRGRTPDEIRAAGISVNPLRDDRRLFLGYAERFAGMILMMVGLAWGVLLLYGGRALWLARRGHQRGWSSLWARYRVRELAASGVTVLAVGAWVRWLIR